VNLGFIGAKKRIQFFLKTFHCFIIISSMGQHSTAVNVWKQFIHNNVVLRITLNFQKFKKSADMQRVKKLKVV
jgi:hypothetical protein